MIYTPNAKELVYRELFFISTSVPVQSPAISMDAIMDEVSSEIYQLFIGPVDVETVSTPALNQIGLVFGSEIAN